MNILTPYKICACGDIHAELDLFELVLKHAKDEGVDLLILVGDFCNDPSSRNQYKQVARLRLRCNGRHFFPSLY